MTVRFRGFEEEPLKKALDIALLRRLWPFVRAYRASFVLTLAVLLVHFTVEIGGTELLRRVFDGPVTDAVLGRPVAPGAVGVLGALYGGYVIAFAALGYAFSVLSAWNGQRVIRDVRERLFSHLMGRSSRFFEKNAVGKLVTRVTSDVENLNELISTGLLQTLFDLVKIAGVSAYLFVLSWKLALFALGVTPVVIGVSLWFRRHARDSYRNVRGKLAKQNAFTGEMIGGMRTTRVFGQEKAVTGHYEELNRATCKSWLATVLHFSLFFSVMDAVIRLAQVGILWFGGNQILGDALTAGLFVQFWMLFNKLGDPIRELGEKYNVLQSAFSSTERIFQILDDRSQIEERPDARPSPRGPARIEVEDVSFEYVKGVPVLRSVSFTALPGQRVAIVGPTGAGKSTVLALLSRLLDPTSGVVRLDGTDLRELGLVSVRQRIAVVPQDVFLFTGTVLDNVRLFDESIPRERVEQALRTVGAWDFVSRLEGGLEARVHERGGTFSQGERQLLALARALAHEPDLLILDEATANIDTRSEARIQEALHVVLRGRTAIVVAHRLSTVRDADAILVVHDGRIVEQGTHEQLVRQSGFYARMLQRLAG